MTGPLPGVDDPDPCRRFVAGWSDLNGYSEQPAASSNRR